MDDSVMFGIMDPNLKIVPIQTTDKEEGNSEVGGEKFKLRRCKEKSRLTNIESLPDELIFDILVRLEPQDIVNGARLVCRKWGRIVDTHTFRHAHLHRSTPGLIIQFGTNGENAVFVTIRRGQIQISKYSFEFRGLVGSSCNGLIVESGILHTYPIYIANPATNQRFTLPSCLCPIKPFRCFRLAYAAASMQYKVVLTPYLMPKVKKLDCAIMTIGVDNSWRIVDTKHLSLPSRKLLTRAPLTTEGLIHWSSTKGTHIVTLNVETEIITETAIPVTIPRGGRRYLLSSSRSSFVTLLVESSDFSWEFWNTKPENGGWTELTKIDLEPQKCKFEHLLSGSTPHLKPIGWLNEEILVFKIRRSRVCLIYNVHTEHIDLFKLNCDSDHHRFKVHRCEVHRHSLVFLG